MPAVSLVGVEKEAVDGLEASQVCRGAIPVDVDL
jgi:hypothetical protein